MTKPATALAALVAVEEGTVALDEPAGPPGSTVRHLLAHASGLGPEPGPPVGAAGHPPDLLERRLRGAGRAPRGARRACRSPSTWPIGVLEPLGHDRHRARPGRRRPAPRPGSPGPLVDLLALGCGAGPSPDPGQRRDPPRAATSVQFPGLAGVLPGFGRFDPCDWGLGVGDPRRQAAALDRDAPTRRPPSGTSDARGSFLWVDPVAGVVCAGLADRPFGPWAARAWPALADAVLAEVGRRPPSRLARRRAGYV